MEEAFERRLMDDIVQVRDLGRGYYPTRWLQMIQRYGGVEAAKRLLHQHGTQGPDGGKRLHELGLDFLSVEWAVLDPKFKDLFSDEDRALAYMGLGFELRRQVQPV